MSAAPAWSGSRTFGHRRSPRVRTTILLVPIQGPSVFQSYVAVTALLEVLAGMVVAHSGQSVIEKMDHLELRRREMGAYWPM